MSTTEAAVCILEDCHVGVMRLVLFEVVVLWCCRHAVRYSLSPNSAGDREQGEPEPNDPTNGKRNHSGKEEDEKAELAAAWAVGEAESMEEARLAEQVLRQRPESPLSDASRSSAGDLDGALARASIGSAGEAEDSPASNPDS